MKHHRLTQDSRHPSSASWMITLTDARQKSTIGAAGSPPDGTPDYDPDGNLIDDDNRIYLWDAWNRLREVKNKTTGSLIASYTYDALGRRVSKSTTAIAAQGAETVLFIYDQWNVIQEWSSPTLDKAYLVWGDDLSATSGRELVGQGQQAQGAGGVGGLLMRQITGGQTLYYHYDANGNPARLTNATNNGGIYRYDAFGNIRTARGALVNQIGENPWQFSTKYHDPETGFSYYGYRYYDPVTGRWSSRDPINEEGGANLYAALVNNCVDQIDFLGLANKPPRPIPVWKCICRVEIVCACIDCIDVPGAPGAVKFIEVDCGGGGFVTVTRRGKNREAVKRDAFTTMVDAAADHCEKQKCPTDKKRTCWDYNEDDNPNRLANYEDGLDCVCYNLNAKPRIGPDGVPVFPSENIPDFFKGKPDGDEVISE